ncbi:MAG: DUF2182 domain-containing protein [Gemmatimonadaceae bacterium]|nr:DUF2182 domain-containing protein [Gemmatimonadaceae bacterium]
MPCQSSPSTQVTIAGALQSSAWKAHHLACCREAPARPGDTDCASVSTASICCSGLTAILLVIGITELRAMAVVTAAITVERLAPNGERVARSIGAVVVVAGLFLIARAAGLA